MRHVGLLGAVGETMALLGWGSSGRTARRRWIGCGNFWIFGGARFRAATRIFPIRFTGGRSRGGRAGALALVGAMALLFIGQILFLIDLLFRITQHPLPALFASLKYEMLCNGLSRNRRIGLCEPCFSCRKACSRSPSENRQAEGLSY